VRRLGSRWRPLCDPLTAEAARDLIARAQAALSDDHRAGAERQLLRLYDLLVPVLDEWALSKSADAESATPGLLDLWLELPDIDAERESIEELLLWYAAHRSEAGGTQAAIAPAQDEAERSAQRGWLEQALRAAERPTSQWWRRLTRRAAGSLQDCAHLTVQRGAQVVWERPPPPGPKVGNAAEATTQLPTLQPGDRLTLRFAVPAPGRVLVLHALGDVRGADLEQVLPAPEEDRDGEGVPRRAHELIEVVGEIAAAVATGGGDEHSLILLWGPEQLPPSWGHEVLARRSVPTGCRLYRYCYSVAEPSAVADTTSQPAERP
jgi:hypothetical protein